MVKKIIILIILCSVSWHYVMAQSKATIEPFFENEFKEKVRFEMDLPYKVKITTQTIKRSNTPEFEVYVLTPNKKKSRVKFSISQTQNSIAYNLQMYKDSGGNIEKKLDNTYLIKFIENDNNNSYHAIILKQVDIGSKSIGLELTVTGEGTLLDKELPQLLNSFHASTISY